MIVGRKKINANIGNSAVTSTIEEEVEKQFGLAAATHGFINRKTFTKLENGLSVILQYLLEQCLSTKL
jgi:thiamine biosynthesis protein ThiC